MLDENLISIVIPVHNAAAFIADTIASVRAQDYGNWELILVNDGSQDKSLEVMESFLSDERIHIVNLKTSVGAARARNEGVKHINGRYLCFLDADDLWDPQKLSLHLAFVKEKQCAFSFTGYEFATSDGVGVAKIVTVPAVISYRQAIKNTTIFTSTVMMDMTKLTKELIEMPDIPSEDSATWWKILKGGNLGYGLQRPLTLYRRSNGTLSSNKFEAIKRIWNLYRKQEHFSVPYSAYCFCFYAFNAVFRRL